MIKTLQAGRFFAALAVVLHHAVISVAAFVGAPPDWVHGALNYGYLGVDFFFVLSGFIIYYTMNQKPRPAQKFAADRLARIMIPYLPVGIILAFAYSALPSLSDSGREWSWFSTVTLIPTDLPPSLSVAWTLQHELIFYLIFAALFFSGRIALGLTAWGLAIIAGALWGLPDLPVLRVALAPINGEFIAGVAAAAIYLSGRRVTVLPVLALVALLTFILSGGEREESWIFGLVIAAVLPVVCRAELRGLFVVPNWLVFGGASSYAMYLTHNPLLSVSSRVVATTGADWMLALILSALICSGAGACYYLCWEKPVMRLVNRRRGQVLNAHLDRAAT